MSKRSTAACWIALGLILVGAPAAWSAPDGIAVTLTSPNTTYVAGQNNTFTFNVGLVYTGAEYVDRYQFVFPAGFTVVSGTPASGAGACGADAGVQSICSPAISWARSGVPCSGAFTASGCGAYNDAAVAFTVTVSIPGGFTGPLTVTLNSIGDGFLLPGGTTDVDTVTFQPAGCTLTIACPGDQVASAPPGAASYAVEFPDPTTGGTCTDAIVDCDPASGDAFPLGTSTVVCTATAPGSTSTPTCSFDVTVGAETIQEIPTASTWGLGALALLLAGAAFLALRRAV